MNQFYLKIKKIQTLKELEKESEVQKREHADLHTDEVLAGIIDDALKEINWIAAKNSDYDYIPWAENRNYPQLWKDNYYQPFHEGNFAVLLEIPLDDMTNIPYIQQIDLILDFFRKTFYEDNILSLMVHNSEPHTHCHILLHIPEKIIPALKQDDAWFEIRKRLNNHLKKHDITYQDDHSEDKDPKNLPFLNRIDYYIPKKDQGFDRQDQIELVYDAKSVKAMLNPDMKIEKQEAILDKVLEYFTKIEKRMVRKARKGDIKREEFFDHVTEFLSKKFDLNEKEMEIMLYRVDESIFGYYVLDDLINDDSISDIKVISPDLIRIKRYGKRLSSNLHFRDIYDYERFCDGVAIRNNSDLSPMNSVQNFTDTTTNKNNILRFNICTNYVNSVPYPYIHIRKISRMKKDIEDLYNAGMIEDLKIAAYLLEKVKTASGILFTGKGGSGKTTLMNTLLEYIPYSKSGLIIQENEELFTYKHPDLMFQHTVIPRTYDEPPIGLADLARNGLLTDLDYFIIGEIKGAEALPFLNAAYTGHQCWASVHGASSTQALNKLADYVKYASDYSREDALKMLMSMDVIIYMKDYKIYEISEISGWDYEKKEIKYKTIYKKEIVLPKKNKETR